jgi:hypothetical protein
MGEIRVMELLCPVGGLLAEYRAAEAGRQGFNASINREVASG